MLFKKIFTIFALMTINQIIYNIRNQIKQSRPDDLQISDRQLEFMVNYIREKLLVQHLENKRSISSNIKQDLGQVEVISVDKSDGSVATGRKIFRTLNKVPQPIELNQKDLFTYVGGLDKQTGFQYKTKANARWNKFNKYASKQPLAYYNDGYIFIEDCPNPHLKYINIEGVFLNPRDVHNFRFPNGNTCYNPDTDSYPLSGRFLDMLNSLIKSQELNIFLQIAENTTNNADSQS